MSAQAVLVQLSDPHIGAGWAGGDPARGLAATVNQVRRLGLRPAGLLVSGDVADHAADAEYAQARELLAGLGAPVYALAGNHDERSALRRGFDLPGAGDEPVQYAADLGDLRLVVLDTTVPGEDRGELDDERLAWLDAKLAGAPGTPTLVAMHHPPLVTGVPAWDELCLPPADRRALAGVIARHPHVRCLTAGHLHRTIAASLAGRPVLSAPSTYAQARLDLTSTTLDFAADPPGFAVHALVDGELISHVQAVS